ncbi:MULTISPECIES: hypothetical protein [Acetobacter]|uniref:Uncharacterized protein n=5 Tax=Acetobacter pasteurianus TaxID=438 RepID=A0A401WWT4_ACEPA|nr:MULTISPECIES: hypothetical protein [Acetobacter]NLG91218.1 hypothetical protein [Acetobacter sp.]BAU39702.1 hypothetical protein APT_02620 [Acetobacter pasteurianus NBRC 101655]ASC05693.1 hypothetical protein S101468_01438 [Acetobacter pasteurianus subsp. pasteurianus]MCP1203514.1 hypothetical protein [Acetobacter oryzoeni]OAZ61241.1 hypothetical protein SRCM100623_02741 [Acetobacter pasteurianus]
MSEAERQNSVVSPASAASAYDTISFKECCQMAGAMFFVFACLALGLHAIYYAGY